MNKPSRNTRQKQIIEEEVNKMTSFFTGEELSKRVKKRDFNIGLATIYRFLKNLREKNKIHSFNCERKIIYSINMKNHCHIICERCGKVSHINVDKIDFLRKIEFDVCHFQIDVYGLCENCKSSS